MISARVQLTEESNRVLNVVKAKFGLKDKSEALNKLIDLNADDFLDRDASDEYVKHILDVTRKHEKKYGKRKMTLEELDKLTS